MVTPDQKDPHATLGASIPANTEHAVSVSLPTWAANVGYEEGEEWVLSKLKSGYPRFVVHASIQHLASLLLSTYATPSESALLFPTPTIARKCRSFILAKSPSPKPPVVKVLDLVPSVAAVAKAKIERQILSSVSAVIFPKEEFPTAKQFWQHSGDGISSRRAEFLEKEFLEGRLVEKESAEVRSKGPTRYSKTTDPWGKKKGAVKVETPRGEEDCSEYVEQRFGRNLSVELADKAKLAIRRRIAGCLSEVGKVEGVVEEGIARGMEGLTEEDVYLYPSGMSSIFNAHQLLLAALGEVGKCVCFGFPYLDTLKILQKFTPDGCHFYGHGSEEDLDDLEAKLQAGEKILGLFCEFPSNPLLKSPDLKRIYQMATKYGFAVVVDETVGNFLNVSVLPHADIVVSSLTKVFSGDSNVMGGGFVFNPKSPLYSKLKEVQERVYEDTYFPPDAIFLERNSRDFAARIQRINASTETLCDFLSLHVGPSGKIKALHYPKFDDSLPHYLAHRTPNGGFGGLFSITFHSVPDAVQFFDRLEAAKGPSLGTNFTLVCPYTVIAHWGEMEWAARWGVGEALVRVSVGLEGGEELCGRFARALGVDI
ncbi:cystathionine gamma-synthase-like protein [Ascobolus immersus RN42]|uniref:cystathionine gamma-synthase n=1 Tax=Ascobolus immersus RN42 TaxID=1160509 RepID=A0A3N4HIS0_ASCIM|nr:cystathionine gamma-synthase-like protein [Ascobolus immersus RN42]